jgi:hypothetical protein
MKAGTFNIMDYLERLTEEAASAAGAEKKPDSEGLIIPDTNQKSYKWLQSEYNKGKVEVKVEMNIGTKKFDPGYELQTNLKSVKDFKPGMFGQSQQKDSVDGLKTNNFGGKETKQEEPKEAEAKPTPPPAQNKNVPQEKNQQKPVANSEPKEKEEQKKQEAPKQFKIKKAQIK